MPSPPPNAGSRSPRRASAAAAGRARGRARRRRARRRGEPVRVIRVTNLGGTVTERRHADRGILHIRRAARIHSRASWPHASRSSTTSCSTSAAPSGCSPRSARRGRSADVFTAVYDARGTEGRFAAPQPRTSFLQRVRPTSRTFRAAAAALPARDRVARPARLRRRRLVLERLGARRARRSRRGARLLLPQPVPLRVDGARADAAGAQPARPAGAAPAAQPLAPVGLDRRPARRPLRRQLARDGRADRALLRARARPSCTRRWSSGASRPVAREESATTTSCSPS